MIPSALTTCQKKAEHWQGAFAFHKTLNSFSHK
jgi:hypothetical protein